MSGASARTTTVGNPIGLTWADTGVYVITATHFALDCPSEPVTYTVTVKECEELVYWILLNY